MSGFLSAAVQGAGNGRWSVQWYPCKASSRQSRRRLLTSEEAQCHRLAACRATASSCLAITERSCGLAGAGASRGRSRGGSTECSTQCTCASSCSLHFSPILRLPSLPRRLLVKAEVPEETICLNTSFVPIASDLYSCKRLETNITFFRISLLVDQKDYASFFF